MSEPGQFIAFHRSWQYPLILVKTTDLLGCGKTQSGVIYSGGISLYAKEMSIPRFLL